MSAPVVTYKMDASVLVELSGLSDGRQDLLEGAKRAEGRPSTSGLMVCKVGGGRNN